MPFDRNAWKREWRANRTEEQKKKEADQKKQYYIDNPHVKKISGWKSRGMILRENEDWESIYIEYMIQERCDDCNCILNDSKLNSKGRRCLDHDHKTGFIRGIVCIGCNQRRH